MKRGKKPSIESIVMLSSKPGDIFWTEKDDKHMTSLACYHDKKILTERHYAIDAATHETITRLTKVIFI